MTAAGWWRRNRWGLLALPFVLAAALLTASYRVEEWWWLARPREAVDAGVGAWVEFTDTLYDRSGEVPIEVSVRLAGVEDAAVPFGRPGDDLQLPAGTRGAAVMLDLRADADAPLTGCRLSVVSADGTEYAYQATSPSMVQAGSPCVPPETPGPSLDLIDGLGTGDGEPRPARWSAAPVVVVPADAEIVEVRLTWGAPRYLAFRTSP
ncbi:hypothetical protein [Phytoactinopolyspora halotolerans]|uniref:Uncharacterized protein n=1 Tax=Phytoactinopolyspora halotolerans TaxID=1981512 RepID=A0A6L9S762_9ACTN|nr:hypothetical protein [Phytoactinopolyspora halotolerans]NEE00909.1 hypothetical protein [Phytoactinopolyspora halotolerans]